MQDIINMYLIVKLMTEGMIDHIDSKDWLTSCDANYVLTSFVHDIPVNPEIIFNKEVQQQNRLFQKSLKGINRQSKQVIKDILLSSKIKNGSFNKELFQQFWNRKQSRFLEIEASRKISAISQNEI
ncbi:hypothetical protein [Gluconobacter cerinus]|uniref:hypothetical protein n=1 Tax=Gluconobacter cerinus TaxID=38307 RepID=UPI001B8C2C88|nr:hypothetical protein [Gluconobacter cerinus]MBS1035555.1 hypothetical protein [Gluconobacter cerinus]